MAQREPAGEARGACPSLDSVIGWQRGLLPDSEAEELGHHLDVCETCREEVEALLAADPVGRHLRQGPPAEGEAEAGAVTAIVRRMRGLAGTPPPGSTQTLGMAPGPAGFHFLDRPQGPDEIGRFGPYRVLRLIGQGGMGQVFEAEDPHLQRAVALKLMRPETVDRPEACLRFLREARSAAAVRHPHVVAIHQVGENNGVPFLVMELLQGQSLEARCRTGPPLSLPEVVRIGREIAEGLAAVHGQGLVHRDVKPDNVWLEEGREDGGEGLGSVKLLDFGLARATAGDARITHSGLVVGTPAYVAPEQACGQPVDHRTDLFGLGCVLYRLVAGQLPFQGETPLAVLQALATQVPPPLRQLRPEVPESLSRLVASLLARRREDRPESARAVAEALQAVEREGTPACAVGGGARRWVYAAFAVALLALASAAAAVVLRLETEHGEVVIRTSDPNVAVLVEQGKVRLHERKSGKKYDLALGAQKKPSGDYELVVTDEAAGLTFTTRQFELKRGDSVLVQVSYEPKKPAVPRVAVPADDLKRADVPEDLLARAGGGDPAKAPAELVAVLGGHRHFPVEGATSHYLHTCYSGDGRLLATVARNQVLVYVAATGKVHRRLSHDKQCGWLAFRPDNGALAVSCENGIEVWDLGTGKSLARLTGHAHLDRGITFTPDGRSLLTTDADGKARLWDVGGQKVVRTFEPPKEHRFSQAPQVHREGKLVALHASGPRPSVQVLDVATGKQQTELHGTTPSQATGAYQSTVRFSPDGRLLASVRQDKAIHVWEVATWKEVAVFEGGASVVSFSADGATLLRGHTWNWAEAKVLLDDVKTRTRKATWKLPLAGGAAWSDLSPDGRTIAVRPFVSWSVCLFDAATGKEQHPPAGHRNGTSSVAVSPDGRWLASTGHDHRALLWDLRSGRVVRELAFAPSAYQRMFSASFSPDGKWVAALAQETSSPGWVRVWETASGKQVANLPGKGQSWHITELDFHPKGGSLMTAQRKALVQRGIPDGSSTTWQEGHDQPIDTLSYHPDGRRVAAGDRSGAVCVWDTSSYKRLCQYRCEGAVTRVRFSPDGKTLAATTEAPDAALYLWDLRTGTRTRRVGHSGDVRGLAWRPDSQSLATSSDGGEVWVWPRHLEQAPWKYRSPGQGRRAVAFTPEGRHLVAGNDDGSIFVLRLDSGDQPRGP